MLKNIKIAIIGLGYVGLPLAVEFSKKYNVVGFDIDKNRINDLEKGFDKTNEIESKSLLNCDNLLFSYNVDEIKDCNFFIVTVPTPIDKNKAPNLFPLLSATKLIARILKKGDIVIYESTVYPGCTEEECVPILEKISNLKFNVDFYCGYSPERINPGDKINTLTKIKKVTSGSNREIAIKIDNLYKSIISAGTHLAPSIKVAEASKAIENAQRDINISFVNELALIFDKLDIDTNDVLDAASTKWNFLKYKPGLVGGHCIGVDPYYLAHKAESIGYHPHLILSGRRINDAIGKFVAEKVVKLLINRSKVVKGSRLLLLGITFKENCPDIRNSKVIDIYNELIQYGFNIEIYDPIADSEEVYKEHNIKLVSKIECYDAIILAVSHSIFLNLNYLELKKEEDSVIYDIKSILDRNIVDGRL